MSAKVRVYEVARDLGMENKALVAMLQSLGVPEVRNHMSAIATETVDRVKRHLEKQNSEKAVEEHIRATVVRRRSVPKMTPPPELLAEAPPQALSARAAQATTRTVPDVPEAKRRLERPAVRGPAAPAQASTAERLAVADSSPRVRAVGEAEPATQKAVRGLKLKGAPAGAVEDAEKALAEPPVDRAPATLAPEIRQAPAVVAAPIAEARPLAAQTSPEPRPLQDSAPEFPPRVEPEPAGAVASAAAPEDFEPVRPSEPPRRKTGIDVWEGRPGVPMPQALRTAPPPRRVQYDAKAQGPGSARPRSSGPAPQMGSGGPRGVRGLRHRGIGTLARAKGSGQAVTQERSAHKKVVRIEGSISLQSLAAKIGVKATEVLMKLMKLGMTGVNINSALDADTSKIVASEFGWEVEDVTVSEEDALVAAQGLTADVDLEGQVPRPPVVTVMGHVDHGKTSLLDRIRKANVVSGEAGGITQHIGAYSVALPQGKITFLDTPGHEAFTQMRARGAKATDIVILVVAADDGVMPQTREAVEHARAANAPIVVAINKCDKPEAQPERVRRELSELALVPEEWGGETLFAEVSATTGQGVETLLEQVLLQAEVLELRANPSKPASGVVVEAELDRGRGPVATILVTDGTLHRGDVLLAGGAHGKVRALIDSQGRSLASAGPSDPVSIIGLNDLPLAGDPVHAIRDQRRAQEIAEDRKKAASLTRGQGRKRVSLEEMAEAIKRANQQELRVVIKADVQGSVEALTNALARLNAEKVRVTVVLAGVGAINESDVNLAVASKAIIIGFNTRPAGKAGDLAQKEGVEIRRYSVIYEFLDDIRRSMEGLLAPETIKKVVGKAEVRQTFSISKAGTVAGCMVLEGLVRRSSGIRLYRGDDMIWEGPIASLKRFKDDVKEVKEGFECGISLQGFDETQAGDIFEAYDVEEVRQTLE